MHESERSAYGICLLIVGIILQASESPYSAEYALKYGRHIPERALRATIGLFSIVQLERSVQMLIPAYDFCMPGKECSNDTETPCDSFRKIRFPVNEFFPPAESDAQENQSDGFDPPCCCGR